MAKILVVDDDPVVGEVINAFFTKLKGHTVYTTQNPEEAVDLVQKHDPQVVLLILLCLVFTAWKFYTVLGR